ncbi:mannose-1-phosphate guanyltransferase alpha-like [Ctenocephalides felis]|uniref:mannose-1-phosphate guanyltransferase alpha-like n=1 Tax=Ctenocephalides felis TaxID=7515 RepID=UPI000E6E21F8|nr:mannose-1-phosphate guanyltransferase alpha-like [Ctenocephalides felis]
MQHEYQIKIRYLQEFTALGTAGGMYHFRDLIRGGSPEAFFILNGDVCADFPLQKLLEFHKKQNNALATIMGTEATKEQAINYGCLVMDKFFLIRMDSNSEKLSRISVSTEYDNQE